MNERLKELLPNPYMVDYQVPHDGRGFDLYDEKKMLEYGQKIVQDCANFIREHYDSWDAEPLAWDLELRYGLHGDYA